MDFSGRTIVVTGAGQGIGEACARQLAAAAARVVLNDISETGAAVARAIRDAGGDCAFVQGDAGDAAQVAQLLDEAERIYGLVDGCICAAGLAPQTDFLNVSEDEFVRTFQVNLMGPMLLGQGLARRLVARGKAGSIVNITSTSARLAGPKQASYCSSKAGLEGLTRAMAVALAPYNIRVNALAPGPTVTGMLTPALNTPEVMAPILARTPLGRFAQPSEQANVALFLLSDLASFMTGETVFADGGRAGLNYTMPALSKP
jgi:glucose 1-dehydrogenase